MKKINSNGYAGKVIGYGLIPLAGIPGVLSLINCFFHSALLQTGIWISFGIGLLMEAVFVCILLIELHQDKEIDAYYTKHPDTEKTPQQILDEKLWHK